MIRNVTPQEEEILRKAALRSSKFIAKGRLKKPICEHNMEPMFSSHNDRIREMQIQDHVAKFNTLKEGLEGVLLRFKYQGGTVPLAELEKLLEGL